MLTSNNNINNKRSLVHRLWENLFVHHSSYGQHRHVKDDASGVAAAERTTIPAGIEKPGMKTEVLCEPQIETSKVASPYYGEDDSSPFSAQYAPH